MGVVKDKVLYFNNKILQDNNMVLIVILHNTGTPHYNIKLL